MKLIIARIVSEFNKIFLGTKRVGDSLRLEGRRMTALDVANAATLGYKAESTLNVNHAVWSDKATTIRSYDINGNDVLDAQGNPAYIKENQFNVRNSHYLRNVEPLNLEVDIARRLKVGSDTNSPIINVSSLVTDPVLLRVKDAGLLGGKPENDLYVRRAVDADNADLLNNTVQSQLVVEKARIALHLISDIDGAEKDESGLRVLSTLYVRKGSENLDIYNMRDYFFSTTQAKEVYVNLAAASNTLTDTAGNKSFTDIMTFIKTDASSEAYKATRLITGSGGTAVARTGDEYKTWLITHSEFSTKVAALNALTADRAVRFGSAADNVDITGMDARIKATTVDLASNSNKLQNNTAEDIIATTRNRVLTDSSGGNGLTQGEVDGFFGNNKVKVAVKAIKVSDSFNSDKFENYTLTEVKTQVKTEGQVLSAKYIYSDPAVGGQKSYIDITNDITTATTNLINGASTDYMTLKRIEDVIKANKTAIETSLASEASTRTTNDNTLTTNMGTLSSLTTTAKNTIVAAINELDAEHGVISTLTTTAKNTFVASINELDSEVGALSGLYTTAKNTIVASINEIHTFVNSGTLGTEVNSIETAVGLNTNGTLATISGKNYVNDQTTVLNAIYALDTQLKTTTDKFSAGGGSIKVVITSTNANGTYYPVLAVGAGTAIDLYTDNSTTPYTYNPGTGALSITGNTTIGGTLGVTGATTLSSTLGVTGATTLSSTLGVTGVTTITGALNANGGTSTTNLSASGTLAVTGATTLNSTLAVTGDTTISGTLTANNDISTTDITASGALDVTGATILRSTLAVTGASTLTGALAANGGITTTTISTSGAVTLGTTLGVTGATTLSSTLAVTGNSTLTGSLTANGGIGTTSITASTTLGVTGATTLGSTLGVTGASTLTGLLTANGAISTTNITASGTLGVSGVSTFTSAVNANGGLSTANISASGTLGVTGVSTLSGQLNANGGISTTNITASGSLTVTGDLTVNGTTTTINSTTISVDDKNIELGSVASPTDTTADGGGITLRGSTNKTITWVDSTDAWTLSEHLNIASGKEYRINGTSVLTSTTLGSGVTASSLTSVGTITSGTWSGSFGAVTGANLTNLTAGNLTGTIPSAVLGNSTHFVGTTAVLLNRTSSNQALTGISSVAFPGATSGTITVTPAAVAGTTAITIPATAGTLVTTGDTGTVTNTMLAGSIANAKLTNSSITVNGVSFALGTSNTITSNTTNNLVVKFDTGTTEGTDLFTFNGGAAKTIDFKAGTNVTLDDSTAGAITIKVTPIGGASNKTLSDLSTTVKTSLIESINEIYTFVNSGTLGTEVNSIETAVGLNTNGTLATISGTNYINGETSVLNAIYELDTQLKTTNDRFSAGGGSIKVVVTSTNTNATYYPTLVSGVGNAMDLYADNSTTPFIYNPNLGTMTVPGALTVTGDLTVNGTTTTISSTTISVDDKNIELGSVASPSNTTADGGGITLKGATDKTITWINSTSAWTSSEHLNILTGKEYRINGTSVLTSTTLGSGVTASSLTSVGTITSGTWSGSFGAVSGANLTSLTAGNLTGTIPSAVLGNSTLYIGTTAVALNRASANLALTGLTTVTATTFTGALSGNATTATALDNARTIGITGDLTWTSPAFDGSANVTAAGTLATITDSGSGTFLKITRNSKGLVTGTAAVAQADITGLLGNNSITNAMIANETLTINGVTCTLGGTSTVTANTSNSFTIKIDSGNSEGVDKYTFNGSAAKTLDIKAGANITLNDSTPGILTISSTSSSSNITNLKNSIGGLNTDATYKAVTGTNYMNTSTAILADNGVSTGCLRLLDTSLKQLSDLAGVTFSNKTLDTLTTSAKTSLVAAVNEVNGKFSTYDRASSVLTGATVFSNIVVADGIVTNTATRTLAKSDIGLGNVDNTSDADKPVSTATQNELALKAPNDSPTFTGTVAGITKSMVELANVDNTSDANKPISTATQSALDLKAPLDSPTFTGTVAGITKGMVGLGSVDNTADADKPISTATQTAIDSAVSGLTKTSVGLGNVDNTADADKPISTATQTALNLKAPLDSPTFTGTVAGITKAMIGLGNVDNTADADKPVPAAIQASLDLKAPLDSPTFTGTVAGITKAMIGLGNVDNTADADKPVPAAIQASLDLKAPLADPTFTGTVGGITKAMVGLGNSDNTADADKPISTATQAALDLKAPLADPTFTGTVSGITKAMIGLGNVDNTADADKPVPAAFQTALDLKAPLADPTFTGTVNGITKGMVGLGNVDNTADADKPISSATQTALDLKAPLADPTFTGTVAGITKGMVGLGSVDNTADADKPVSTATQAAINAKTATYTTVEISIDGSSSYTVTGKVFTNSTVMVFAGGKKLRKTGDVAYSLSNDGTDTTLTVVDAALFVTGEYIEIEIISV